MTPITRSASGPGADRRSRRPAGTSGDHDSVKEPATVPAHLEELLAEARAGDELGWEQLVDNPEFDNQHVPTGDFLELYRQEITNKPLLSAAEEARLAQAIEAGQKAEAALAEGQALDPAQRQALAQIKETGRQARESLAHANTRLVMSIAKRYRGQGMDYLDLIQEGNAGLLIAISKFDYRMGNRFSTYATWWIRQCITRALANQGRIIRLPAHLGSEMRRLYRATQELTQQYGREPRLEELAERLQAAPSRIRWLQQVGRTPLNLEQPVGDASDASLADFIADEEAVQPTEVVAQAVLGEEIADVLARLSPREATIMRLRYGLQGYEPHTLKEIGEILNLSRERIRQLEKEILNKLRQPRFSDHLQAFLQ